MVFFAIVGFCQAGERPVPVPQAQWTLAFYLAGENSLEYEQVRNLNEIIAGAAGLRQVNIVVFIDRDERFERENPMTSWKGTRVFYVTEPLKRALRTPLDTFLPVAIGAERFEGLILAQLKNADARHRIVSAYRKNGDRYILKKISTEQEVLASLTSETDYLLPLRGKRQINLVATDEKVQRQFFCFVGDNFPARRYALFMAGHGNGWNEAEGGPAPGTARALSPEYYQPLKPSALAAAARWQHFDLIAMDSCLMADLETLWTLKDSCEYMVLNQIETPAWGLNYTLLLKQLQPPSSLDARRLAQAVVNTYALTFKDTPYPISTAAFESGRIETLARTWNKYFGEEEKRSVLSEALSSIEPLATSTVLRGTMVDFGQLCGMLALGQLQAGFGGPRGITVAGYQQHTAGGGLSIYFPKTAEAFARTISAYHGTSWARAFPHGWVKAVEELYSKK